MRSKSGKRSLLPGWVMTAATLSGLGIAFAVHQMLDPHAVTGERMRQLAAAYLGLGFLVFGMVTIFQDTIKLHRDIRQDRRDEAAFAAHMALHELAHLEALAQQLREPALPQGLCGNREPHEAHEHHSTSLGVFWCTAEESQRLPFAAERARQRPAEPGDS
jgi:hypothetical protein